jgi:large subunit ribosomal protein L23
MTPADIIKRPIALTEKAALLKESNKVVFEVALRANKIEIKKAVEAMFDVDVVEVNTLVQRGKVKRMGRGDAKRPNWKKAIVTLREGDDIQFFDESETESSDSKKEE